MGDDRPSIVAACLLLSLTFAVPVYADIRIGVAGPINSGNTQWGARLTAAAQLAVNDINSAGGILGEKVALEVVDDRCEAVDAVAVANQLVAQDARLVVGHYCSEASVPASAVYSHENIIQISPTATSNLLTDLGSGPRIFRIGGRDDAQAKAAAQYIGKLNAAGSLEIAVAYDGSVYSQSLADQVISELKNLVKPPKTVETFAPGAADYTTLVNKLKSASIGIVFAIGSDKDIATIAKTLKASAPTMRLMGSDAIATKTFALEAGAAADSVLMTLPPDNRITSGANVTIRLKAANADSFGNALAIYAAIQAWAQAAKDTRSFDAAVIAAYLHLVAVPTVIGSVRFDAKGDNVSQTYGVYEWVSGDYKLAP
ncbi:branched-chain amino acid ABC transporter substrate-binding protein [Rhizobium brockwellii]|uniref:branched-chain amino acid ABC transporter substrate-binding protein n=1 Tax=Rhizobium brockwellii TaxID=3019932 RepID=UPI003F9885C4